MSDQSPKSGQTTCVDTSNSTTLPESADGHSHSASQDGPKTARHGRAHVHVSRFRALEKDKVISTNDTSGPLFTRLSPSANLQQFLENSLRRNLAASGCLASALIWKKQDMPSGPPIYRLVLSERLMNASGFGLLPTVSAQQQEGGIRMGGGSAACKKWNRLLPTPAAASSGKRLRGGSHATERWGTLFRSPNGSSPHAISPKHGNPGMVDLAALAAWMMGFPREWLNQLWAVSATPSSRKSRKHS